MFEIETKDLKINEELNRKIDMICRFACVKYEFIPGNIKSIKNTNIAYVKPHILKVKGNDYLILEECEEVFINGYNEKIKLKDSYNKQHKKITEINKKVIVLEAKVESWKRRVNEIVDFISERVKGLFGNILKSKYKDVANDLRENNIITEKEYKKIYDLPIIKDYKENKNKGDFEL